MTTTITVKANHGWPVDVFAHDKSSQFVDSIPIVTPIHLGRVVPGENRDFHCHSSRDLFIHEVQPHEIDSAKVETDEGEGAKAEAA